MNRSSIEPVAPKPPAGEPDHHPRLVPFVLLWLTMAALGLGLWATVVTPHRAALSGILREVVFALSWIAVGTVALCVGRTRIANRLLTLALVLSLTLAGSFGLISNEPYARLIETLTAVLIPLQTPIVGHVLLSYPSGRLVEPLARRLAFVAYVVGGTEAIVWSLGHRSSCAECAVSFTYLGIPAPVGAYLAASFAAAWFILVSLLIWQLVRHFRAAGLRQRKLLRIPYAFMIVAALCFATLQPVAAVRGGSAWGVSVWTLGLLQVLALLGVPGGFLVGLIRERLSHRRIGEFLAASVARPDTDLERALAAALDDPGLTVAFGVDGGFVDGRGNPVAEPSPDHTTQVTAVGDESAPLALISHDSSLADEPLLLTAAGSATRLLLENARLHAEVRAQLLEVRQSRSRIVAAANEARARLERDLHDGAQQRLLAIGIALNLLENSREDPELLAQAREEVAGALVELRALSAGIHPAVLTDFGLLPALDALARRLGSLVTIEAPGYELPRLAPAVEAAAYFSTAEAVTNAVKHAGATVVTVTIETNERELIITITDDGNGGVDPAGQGLVGVRDRLASVDGQLTIGNAQTAGTLIKMVIPCG